MRLLCLLAVLLSVSVAAFAGDAAEDKARLLKGALLVKVTRFIQWSSPVKGTTLCIFDDDEGAFVDSLRQGIAQSSVLKDTDYNIVSVNAEQLQRPAVMAQCQVLYWGQEAPELLEKVRKEVRQFDVLWVSDSELALQQGCHLALVADKGRFHLVVSNKSLADANFKLDSRLLALAKSID